MTRTDDIRARVAAAWDELNRLGGGGRFRMTVPVKEDVDSDFLIGAALHDLDYLLDALTALEAEHHPGRGCPRCACETIRAALDGTE